MKLSNYIVLMTTFALPLVVLCATNTNSNAIQLLDQALIENADAISANCASGSNSPYQYVKGYETSANLQVDSEMVSLMTEGIGHTAFPFSRVTVVANSEEELIFRAFVTDDHTIPVSTQCDTNDTSSLNGGAAAVFLRFTPKGIDYAVRWNCGLGLQFVSRAIPESWNQSSSSRKKDLGIETRRIPIGTMANVGSVSDALGDRSKGFDAYRICSFK